MVLLVNDVAVVAAAVVAAAVAVVAVAVVFFFSMALGFKGLDDDARKARANDETKKRFGRFQTQQKDTVKRYWTEKKRENGARCVSGAGRRQRGMGRRI